MLESNNYSRENNILICKYMGYEIDDRGCKLYKLPNKIIPFLGCEEFGDGDHIIQFKDTFFEWESKFHISWDWLMPVVQKCYKRSPVGIALDIDINKQYNIVMSFIKVHIHETD